MNAFFVAQVTIKNPEKFQQYAKAAGESMAPFGGNAIIKGKLATNLSGEQPHPAISVIGFPSEQSLNDWFNSDAYQALIPLRDEASDMILSSYVVPA